MNRTRLDNELPTCVRDRLRGGNFHCGRVQVHLFLVTGTFGATNAGGYSKDNPNSGEAPGQNKTILHNHRLLFRSTLPD